MKPCNLCYQKEANSDEHVVSEFLGNRTLKIGKGLCTSCNHYLGQHESSFRDNSLEGLRSFLHRIRGKKRIPRSYSFNLKTIRFIHEYEGREVSLFDVFPPPADVLLDQGEDFDGYIAFYNPSSGDVRIYLISELKKEKNINDKKFNNEVSELVNREIYLLTPNQETKVEATTLLQRYHITYNEEESEHIDLSHGNYSTKVSVQILDNIALNVVVAKTAYNFFLKCMIEGGYPPVNYREYLQPIAEEILNSPDKLTARIEFGIPEIVDLDRQNPKENRVANTVVFENINGHVYSRLSLMGCTTYRVRICKYPFTLIPPRYTKFGCGITQDPFTGKIYSISSINYERIKKDRAYFLFD